MPNMVHIIPTKYVILKKLQHTFQQTLLRFERFNSPSIAKSFNYN